MTVDNSRTAQSTSSGPDNSTLPKEPTIVHVGEWFYLMAWRGPRLLKDRGPGFWFRFGSGGWGFAGGIVYRNFVPIFSERYSGQHGMRKRRVLYVPIGFGRRLRFEILHPLGGVA